MKSFITKLHVNNYNTEINNLVDLVLTSKFKRVDNLLLEELYKIYKTHNVNDIYIIDEPEFVNFLKTMLPIYLKSKEEDNA